MLTSFFSNILFTFRAFDYIYDKNYPSTPGDAITLVVFVSTITQEQVKDAKASAGRLQDQQIRVALVAHGNNADIGLLGQVTGDPSTVFPWKADAKEPDNYQDWFKQVINCPTTSR
jgi:hypothetical protein